jgi:glycosyltransferase involved in cell wall biosynthesis
MFGEEDYDASIHRQAASLGIADHVEFMGFRNDIPDLLNDSDIVLHASIIGEPFGQVVIEGMAAGKPVIATDGGALPEIVIPGATGLLVPLGDSKAMAEAIKQLLSNPVNARMMGIAGRRRVYEKFTIRHTAQMAQDIYLSLMNHPLSNAPRVITDGVGMAHMDGMLRTASLK